MSYYRRRFFHLLITANLFLFFSGCGYKSNPTYQNSNRNKQFLSKLEHKTKEAKKIASI